MSTESKKLLSVFRQYDDNGDGVIDAFELAEVLGHLDSKWSSEERVNLLFDALDSDDNGCIEMDEFVEWVFGHNMEANDIMATRPAMALRLNGFGLRSYQELAEALEPLGDFRQLHHVKGNAKESLVIYNSEDDARKVFEALGGTYDAEQAAAGELRVRCKSDSPLFKGSEAHFDVDQVICLTPKVYSSPGEKQTCPASFIEELSAFITQHEASFGDDYSKWVTNVGCMRGSDQNLPHVAKQLRLISLNVEIKDGQKENAAMWRRTMRLLAKGELEFQDPTKISDILQELAGFMGAVRRPPSPAKERATKKAKDMGVDDPWAAIGRGGRNNSALSAFAASF